MAEFQFKCPQCGADVLAEDELRGQVLSCPYCEKGIVVPRMQNVHVDPRNLSLHVESTNSETLIKCPNCGNFLELPNEMRENGVQFECGTCTSALQYFNGNVYLKKAVAPTQKPMHQHPIDDPETPHLSSIRRLGRWWGSQSRMVGRWWGSQSRMGKFGTIVAAMMAMAFLNGLFSPVFNSGSNANNRDNRDNVASKAGVESKSEFEKKLDRCNEIIMNAKGEETNSIKFVEALLYMKNAIVLMLRDDVKKHKAFLKALDRSGYMVANEQYSDGELVSLIIVNTSNGMDGTLQRGLSEGSFRYPAWMPEKDANMIWKHFSRTEIDRVEKLLRATEDNVSDLETKLAKLKRGK